MTVADFEYGLLSDLSTYQYGREQPGLVHVGWLDGVHNYPKGFVAPHLIAKLKKLARNPVNLYRGKHICEVCSKAAGNVSVGKNDPRYPSARRSFQGPDDIRFFCPMECLRNGEIRITARVLADGSTTQRYRESSPTPVAIESGLVLFRKITYAAPIIITHYIEAHGYLPPAEFLKALEAVPD